jgi:hypothetical protein
MPFVEGESLRDRLDRETQLPVEDAIQITLEVADALGHAPPRAFFVKGRAYFAEAKWSDGSITRGYFRIK